MRRMQNTYCNTQLQEDTIWEIP